jgi:hypothetical protein
MKFDISVVDKTIALVLREGDHYARITYHTGEFRVESNSIESFAELKVRKYEDATVLSGDMTGMEELETVNVHRLRVYNTHIQFFTEEDVCTGIIVTTPTKTIGKVINK